MADIIRITSMSNRIIKRPEVLVIKKAERYLKPYYLKATGWLGMHWIQVLKLDILLFPITFFKKKNYFCRKYQI